MNRWLVWNILFRLQERLKGHPTFGILREMEAADRLSIVELDQLRNRRLGDFIDYCYRHVPYVRMRMQEAGVGPSDIRQPSDLKYIPVMTKADVRAHRESLRSGLAAKLTPVATSGSTGAPLVMDLSDRRIASHVACRQRVNRWWGGSAGVPELALWGPAAGSGRKKILRRLRDSLLSTRLLSAYEMTGPIMSGYLDIIETGHWRQMFAYPSAAYMLCMHARKHGRNLRGCGIRVVFVTGELLLPHQEQVITDTLGCPVANGYGGRESGFVAHQCPEGGMHIMADAVIVEALDPDGQPVPTGEAGELVVTDLYSREAPVLRYATGDSGVISSGRCPCGRPLPLIERLEGRSLDAAVAADGRLIPALALNPVLWKVDGIEQARIFQRAVGHFHLEIVRGEGFQPASEENIREGFREVMRSPVQVTFEYARDIIADPSGKRRFFISDLDRGRGVRKAEETTAG